MTENKKQSLSIKFIFSIVVLIIFVLMSETLLRVIDIDFFQKNQFFPTNRDIDFIDYYKKDSDLFWRFRAGITIDSERFSHVKYKINDHGMRGDNFKIEKDKTRIITIGNSCTFGWGVEQNKIWTTQLENILNSRAGGNAFEVINAGVPGYSSHQGKIYFEQELLELKPDVIFIMFGWNDQRPAGKNISDAEQQPPGALIMSMQNVLSQLKIYQLFRKIILSSTEKQDLPRIDQLSGKKRVSIKEFSDNLKSIIRTAKEKGIMPVLLIPPVASLDIYLPGQTSYFHKLHERYQNVIKNSAGYEQVTLVNLQEVFDQYGGLFDSAKDDPIHFNSNGHKIAAETLSGLFYPVDTTGSF